MQLTESLNKKATISGNVQIKQYGSFALQHIAQGIEQLFHLRLVYDQRR